MKGRQAPGDLIGATIMVIGATGLAASLTLIAPLESVSAIYMLPVLVSAVRYGTKPAMLAALLGAFSTSLFYPPVLSIQVVQPWQIVDLVISLSVALVMGRLAARTRDEMLAARQREGQIKRLYDLGSAMAAASDAEAIYTIVAAHMSEALSRPVAVFVAGASGRIDSIPSPVVGEAQERVLKPAVERTLAAPPGAARDRAEFVEVPGGESWLLFPLGDAERAGAVLAVAFGRDGVAPASEVIEEARLILREGSRSLERLGLTRAVEERNMRQRSDELRDILLESVSHELRTPIAGIMGSAGVLAAAPALRDEPQLVELACGIEAESRRLDMRIQSLLDVTRIRSGALVPRLEAIDLLDVVNAALDAAADRLREHRICRDFGPDLPLVRIDAVLVEQALINLLENAGKFSPPGSTIRIGVRTEAETVRIAVSDEGAGLEPSQREQIFERFYRGARHADLAGGSGLGLTIAQVFVAANGGRIDASSAGPGQGTRLAVTLPRLREAPAREGDEHE